ncbi:uncharacterized protein TRIADDRAFT_61970 [Trichoplax adhaerens]|uniref:Uncharacterized protein n=1 Tax=Trichoplax adhaerens TaxID=10228 RepID=B3SCH3_TRIAD|nr:hypothetical protein TRIADDRAFT_61970 [Trichoplax adhaerens]EDV19595.1 hypothetical protein TRIADDRAFT_61970 [Trichoplax adhaerens]|eukprot:XP_002117928.1 hypothetical protein TRIADDRAFT_61970 [Trichoplax adhaerens]
MYTHTNKFQSAKQTVYYLVEFSLIFQIDSLQIFINKAENHTVKVFNSVNQNFTEKIAPIFQRQHGCFLNFIKIGGQSRYVEETFIHEFEELFYQFYYNFLSPASQKKNGQCIKLSMRSISPFGKIPDVVSSQASKLAKQLRFINSLLSDIFNILDTAITEHKFSSSCLNALTRMNFCSSCSLVAESVRPCRDMCINVMKGCLAALADIGPLFQTFIDAVDDMTKHFSYITKLITLFEYYAANISNGMQIAVSSADSILDQVRLLCDIRHQSDPIDNLGHIDFPVDGRAISGDIEFHMAKLKLFQSLQSLKDRLKTARFYFTDLPYKICLDTNVVEKRKHQACWNGKEVGRYKYQIVHGNGTNAQLKNPELDVVITDNYRLIVNVSMRINHLISEIMDHLPNKVTPRPIPTNGHIPGNTGSGCIGSGNYGSGHVPDDNSEDDCDRNNANESGSTMRDKDDELTTTEATYGASTVAADDDITGSSGMNILVTASNQLYVQDYQTKLPIETTTSGAIMPTYNRFSLFGSILITVLVFLLCNRS